MSMNLSFNVVGGPGHVDFPFQTPTKLTWAVLDCVGIEERIQIIHDWIDETEWDNTTKEEKKSSVSALMNSPHLELTFI